MSATDTALAVIHWAHLPPTGRPGATDQGPPPHGDLGQLEDLLTPTIATRQALAGLAAAALARLGLTPEPGTALDPAALFLATALGAIALPEALELLRALDPPHTLADLATRHTLVAPALEHLPPPLARELVAASPLTALLRHPPPGGEDATLLLGERLLATRDGRRLVIHQFALPITATGPLAWRGRVLEQLRLEAALKGLVLDVYEAAIGLHGRHWLRLTQQALAILADETANAFAFAVGRWWEPLLGLYRAHHDSLRERTYLDFQIYLAGIRLAQVTTRLREGLH